MILPRQSANQVRTRSGTTALIRNSDQISAPRARFLVIGAVSFGCVPKKNRGPVSPLTVRFVSTVASQASLAAA